MNILYADYNFTGKPTTTITGKNHQRKDHLPLLG